MSAPVIEETWVPEGWDEPAPPCELRWLRDGPDKCDNPAEVAYRLPCCSYVKRVCALHWEFLISPGGVTLKRAIKCRGCGAGWAMFIPETYWRI